MTTAFITSATQKQTDTLNSPRQRCERLRIAAEMYALTDRLESIVQQCGQESLFDAILLDHFDQLALLSRVVTEAAGAFAGDPNYSPE